MGFKISKPDIQSIVNCVPDAIERVLKVVQIKLENYLGGHSNVPMKKKQKKKSPKKKSF